MEPRQDVLKTQDGLDSMSRASQKQWIVRNADGKIYGPFSKDQVLEQIDRNFFLGDEQIAEYPGGRWISISKSPEFYDRLLDVLAAEVRGNGTSGMRQAPEPAPSQDTKTEGDPIKPEPTAASTRSTGLSVTVEQPHSDGPTATFKKAVAKPGNVIELTDLKSFELKQKFNASKIPLIIIGLAILLAIGAFMVSGQETAVGDRIHLLSPRKGQPEIAETKINEKFNRAINFFQADTFLGYQKAQNEIIEAIEGASMSPESAAKRAKLLSTLCLVYRELWPFAYQDARDLRVMSDIMQAAKRWDPAGLHGGLCELVSLMINGRFRDAQGLTDQMLTQENQTPVLFEMRGDIYFYMRDYKEAVTYFSQARSLWPVWQKTAVQEARARAETKKYQEAIDLYRGVLQKSPNHGVAKVELGLIEGTVFKKYDKGIELIEQGLQASDRVPKPVQANGFFGLAQIYLATNQKGKALENANLAYQLNTSNLRAKELLERLGGATDKTRPEARELIYLGEQYVRAGDFFAAQAQFKAAFEADPKNGMAAMKAGKCLWQLNQSLDAIDWMKKAITADRQLIPAYVELADYYAQRFDYFSAIEILKTAQGLQPQNYEVYRGFAQLELRRNDFKRALSFAEKALKLYNADLETNLIMAKAHLGLNQYPEARRYAGKAIELDFSSLEAHSLYAKIEAGIHGVEAGAAYIKKLLNKYVITQGQQIPQAAIDYRVTLGEIYMQEERYNLAEDMFRQAISLDPVHKPALIALGKVLQAQNQVNAALEAFLRAAVLDPSDADPIFLSGQLYMERGDNASAIRQFERVLKINSRYPKAHVALGKVAIKMGDPKKAIEEASQERAINPDLSDAYILAAEAYYDLKQYTNCAAEYQKAVSKRGHSVVTLVRMARCYRLSGALDSASSLLKQAQALESGNADVWKEQGALYHMKGMAEQAVTAYSTYLQLMPNATDKAEIEAAISKAQSGELDTKGP